MPSFFFWLSFLHLLNPSIPTFTGHKTCKAVPNTRSWPPESAWTALNSSISGHLLKHLPPSSVCDSGLPVYNNATCVKVFSQYRDALFHAQDPVSVGWPNWGNDACLPTTMVPCNLEQFPVYVVNASEKQHVQAGVNYARNHNVRLIVKGTGLDFLGR